MENLCSYMLNHKRVYIYISAFSKIPSRISSVCPAIKLLQSLDWLKCDLNSSPNRWTIKKSEWCQLFFVYHQNLLLLLGSSSHFVAYNSSYKSFWVGFHPKKLRFFHFDPGNWYHLRTPGMSHRSPPAAAPPSTRRPKAGGRGHPPGDGDSFYDFVHNTHFSNVLSIHTE